MKNKLNLSKEQLDIIDDELKRVYVPEKRTRKKKSLPNIFGSWHMPSPDPAFTISSGNIYENAFLTTGSSDNNSIEWRYITTANNSNNNGENNNE